MVEYIWLDEQPLAAVRPRVGATADAPNSEQEVFALHSDHLGTPRVALDTAGRVRWRWMGGEPFGVNPAENNPEGLGELNLSLRLPGQQYDGFVGCITTTSGITIRQWVDMCSQIRLGFKVASTRLHMLEEIRFRMRTHLV